MLAVHLLRQYSTVAPQLPNSWGNLPKHRLQDVLDYIKADLEHDIRLMDLAALVGMSQDHFVRSFKQFTGLTPHRYMIQRRVERAKQLLWQRDLSIAEVAFKVLAGVCPRTVADQSWRIRGISSVVPTERTKPKGSLRIATFCTEPERATTCTDR